MPAEPAPAEPSPTPPPSALVPPLDIGRLRRARLVRRAFLSVVAVFVGLGACNVFGSTTQVAEAATDGLTARVESPRVTRAGLAAPVVVRVVRDDAAEGPITVSIPTDYLSSFDENGREPEPDASAATSETVEWTFDTDGRELVVQLDQRVEPGHFGHGTGEVVVTSGGRSVTSRLDTWFLP